MNGNIVCNMINQFNNDLITFPCHQWRPWELTVNTENASCMTQSGHIMVIDLHLRKSYKIRTGKTNLTRENLNICLVNYIH